MATRIAAIEHTLGGAGHELPPDWVLECPFSIVVARQAFRKLMSAKKSRPSAIVCGNDVLAMGALLEAKAMGFNVPDDVSVTGFDDMEWASQIPPRLTTVRMSLSEMGIKAADYLIGRLNGTPVPHATLIEADLVVRDSTGPCRT
jgi:LacI family transcriptional regulator